MYLYNWNIIDIFLYIWNTQLFNDKLLILYCTLLLYISYGYIVLYFQIRRLYKDEQTRIKSDKLDEINKSIIQENIENVLKNIYEELRVQAHRLLTQDICDVLNKKKISI